MTSVQASLAFAWAGDIERKSIPGPGRTILNEAERYGRHVRRAVRTLWHGRTGTGIEAATAVSFPCSNRVTGPAHSQDEWLRTAWLLTNEWLFVQAGMPNEVGLTLEDAERLFWNAAGGADSLALHFSPDSKNDALTELKRIPFDRGFVDLLPYILDPHGPGSRASVMRDPSTEEARNVKRDNGVFFTPEDVAEFMVEKALSQASGGVMPPSVLDPACGTGVFLRVAFRWLIRQRRFDPTEALASVFGCDICLQSVETCAFVLLHAYRESVDAGIVCPRQTWGSIRGQLAVVDSCLIECDEDSPWPETTDSIAGRQSKEGPVEGSVFYSKSGRLRAETPAEYASAETPPIVRMGDLFPRLRTGADVVVGNPPYNRLGVRSDVNSVRDRFVSLRQPVRLETAETFLLFVEMMWRLSRSDGSACLVVPLSIAYNSSVQFRLCRRAMGELAAEWHLAFFDREPHALFGEDVKTRNAIVACKKKAAGSNGNGAAFHLTGLNRWTSRSRAELFGSLHFTEAEHLAIDRFIPKLGSDAEQKAFVHLRSMLRRLCDGPVSVSSRQLSGIGTTPAPGVVYVSGTAYNFLNVFRCLGPGVECDVQGMSESPVHELRFPSEETAWVAHAVLSSRLTYWLWQVIGDGFHVTRTFIDELPYDMGSWPANLRAELAALGTAIWGECLQRRTRNVNGGRVTFAFRPVLDSPRLTELDSLLVAELGLQPEFAETLMEFVHDVVVMSDHKRLRLMQ